MKRRAGLWDTWEDIAVAAVKQVVTDMDRDPAEMLSWEYIDELLEQTINVNFFAARLADAMWDMMQGRVPMTEQEKKREKKSKWIYGRENRRHLG